MDEAAAIGSPDRFPLTDLQEAYLVGASKLIELGGFRASFYFEIDAVDVDPVRAEVAVNRLIGRHEQLRTVILPDGGQRVLAASDVGPLRIPVTDLSGLPATERPTRLRQIRDSMLDDGPDPARWPLFRVAISRVRDHRCRIHVAMSLLLADAHSIWRLLGEWQTLHGDPDTTLPAVPLTFRQWRLARAEYEQTDGYQVHWRYWQERLDSLPAAPELPLARQPASIDQVRFTRRECRLDRAEWQQFRAHCRRHRILPSAALAHVFAETLGAWAARPHFCLNLLHLGWMNRHPEWSEVIGQLGATVPLEVDLRPEGDFWVRAQRLQGQLWRDLEHADVTAVRVMRAAAARRGWTTRALLPYVFNSMLGLGVSTASAGRPAGRIATSGLRTPHVLIDNQVQDLPDGGVQCVWDVVEDAFPAGLPAVMFGAYEEMLRVIAAAEAQPARGPVLATPDPVPASHRTLVAAINDAPGPPAAGRLEDGFLRQAIRQPDAPAILSAGRTLSYRELQDASAVVAAWLQARGVRRGDMVAVVMPKGWEQVAAVLGVLRAGAAYCPVDAGLPAARIRQLIDRCRARAVLTVSSCGEVPTAGPVLRVDSPAAPGVFWPAAGDPADLAYVIYTSGSTGEPKGVMIEHRAAAGTISDVSRRIDLQAADRVFGISSLSFDLSVWDVFGTLAAGAALVIPAATPGPDPLGWAAAAAAHGVTVWNSVPALAEMLAEVAGSRPELGCPPVRAFLLSGDWIPLPLPGRLRRFWPQARVLALGGATEASIWSNSFEVGEVDPSWRSIPYGRPLDGQTMRVLDHRMGVRPPGAPGRIYIGGAGVARGYLDDEKRTSERFVTDPASGERLYWTGDLGTYWADGTIELLGREDRQLKIQGFRVEPGEVESVIRAQPGVRACAVGAERIPAGGQRLVALVVPAAGPRPDEQVILRGLRAQLPRYMIPDRVLVLDRLPLTANGKVDVARALPSLPAPLTGPVAAMSGPVPGGALTDRLTGLWADVLELTQAGPDSDFFALGGTSLLALRLINRARAELGADLPLGQLFEARTPRALAAALGGTARGTTAAGFAARPTSVLQLAGGTGQELVLFHPVGGSVTVYAGMARAWPGPVRAFQSAGLTDPGALAECHLPALVARYLSELPPSPPRPYVLGGWSMGGVLAYEAATQLAARGKQACVFMIDSAFTEPRRPATPAACHLAFLGDLARGRLPDGLVQAIRAAPPARQPEAARDAAVRHGLLPEGLGVAEYQDLVRVHTRNLEMLARYHPAPSAVPAFLFAATAGGGPDQVTRWRAVCPELGAEQWPCDHYSIVSADSLRRIAAQVAGWSARVLRAGQPAPNVTG